MLSNHSVPEVPPPDLFQKWALDEILPEPKFNHSHGATEKIVVVGASLGGPETLRFLLQPLPPDSPGMVVVQHMHKNFTTSFARSLDRICSMEVKEAENDDQVTQGKVLIAPGNRHTLVTRRGKDYYIRIKSGPRVGRHRPSVDVLFRSAANCAGENAIGLILTGMGNDGSRGMLELKQAGAKTIAEDRYSCVTYSMPLEAIRRGGVAKILPLDRIPMELLRGLQTK